MAGQKVPISVLFNGIYLLFYCSSISNKDFEATAVTPANIVT